MVVKGSYKYPVATYSLNDVADIVEFAYNYGVRVIIEVFPRNIGLHGVLTDRD